MVRIAICDDEKVVCNMLMQKVTTQMKNKKEDFEIDCFANADELLQKNLIYDILLLDIQMPGQNGIELAKTLRKDGLNSALIFITALKEHVFDVFEVDALDYICKPINEMRLEKTLEKALQKIKTNEDNYLLIKTMNCCKAVKISNIFYCEVINRKIYLYTKDDVIVYYSKLADIIKQLDNRFVRCHRSYLVNMDYLIEYTNRQITLVNGLHVPISRLRYQEFMEAAMQYMKREGA